MADPVADENEALRLLLRADRGAVHTVAIDHACRRRLHDSGLIAGQIDAVTTNDIGLVRLTIAGRAAAEELEPAPVHPDQGSLFGG